MENRDFLSVRFRVFVIGLMLVGFTFSTAGPANAGCAKFPSVPWWSGTTHDSVKRYVKVKNGGNWSAYIKKWENQLNFLKGVASKNGSAVVANYKLRGTSLMQYIQKVSARLSIIRCLAGGSAGEIPASKKSAGEIPASKAGEVSASKKVD